MAKKCEECIHEVEIDLVMKDVEDIKKKMNGFNGDPGYSVNISKMGDKISEFIEWQHTIWFWVRWILGVFALSAIGTCITGVSDHYDYKSFKKDVPELYVRKDYFIQYFYTLENKNIIFEHMLLTTKYKDFLEYKIKLDSVNGILKQHEATRGPKKEKEDWLKTDSIQ